MKRFICFLFCFAVLGVSSAWAQETSGTAPVPESMAGMEEDSSLVVVREYKDSNDGYTSLSFENLSRLYWLMGRQDMDSDADIDNFLLINECDLFKQYYNNDFEWTELRKATRQKISRDMHTYPRKFEIMRPIYLGEYDPATASFAMFPGEEIENLPRVEVIPYSMQKVCDVKGDILNYPRYTIFILSPSLQLKSLPVQPELAQLYIEETRTKYESLPDRYKSMKYRRMAYLRIRISVLQYKETVAMANRYKKSVFFAKLDGYEVYADPEKEKILYQVDLQPKKNVNRKKYEGLQRALEARDKQVRNAAPQGDGGKTPASQSQETGSP